KEQDHACRDGGLRPIAAATAHATAGAGIGEAGRRRCLHVRHVSGTLLVVRTIILRCLATKHPQRTPCPPAGCSGWMWDQRPSGWQFPTSWESLPRDSRPIVVRTSGLTWRLLGTSFASTRFPRWWWAIPCV